MKTLSRIEQIAGIAALGLVIVGCFVVLRPFISAVIWAAIVCYCTWPLYERMERVSGHRRNWVALGMVLIVTLVLVVPFVVVGMALAGSTAETVKVITGYIKAGLPAAPAWLVSIPFVGGPLNGYWTDVASDPDRLAGLIRQALMNSKSWILDTGLALGEGILQLLLSVFVMFFFFRDGERVVTRLSEGFQRIAGDQTQHLMAVVGHTVRGVVYGVLGTALAQGVLAAIGFWVAGVDSALLLGMLTFLVALIPFGPPLIWIPVCVWLFCTSGVGWAVFMALWGLLVVSGIDNVLRPYLISRGSTLPFALVLLGVMGGVIAFGFIGLFIGPTLLAVGYCLIDEWSSRAVPAGPGATIPVAAAAVRAEEHADE